MSDRPLIRPWPLRLTLYLLAFVVAHYLSALVAAGVAGALLHGGLSSLGESLADSRWLLLVSMGAALPVIGVTLLWWRHVDRRPLAELGLAQRGRSLADFGRGAGLGTLLVLLTALPSLVRDFRHIQFLPGGPPGALGAFITLAPGLLAVAWNEELACRGVLLRTLGGPLPPLVAALGSSALFTALHLLNPNLTPIAGVNILLAGLMLALAAQASGALWLPAGLHFAWNLALAGLLGLPVSGVETGGLLKLPPGGPAWLTGGAFGPEGGLAATAVLSVACAGFYARRPSIVT